MAIELEAANKEIMAVYRKLEVHIDKILLSLDLFKEN
jgi:hypothetical protein